MKLKEFFLNFFGAFYLAVGLLAIYNSVMNQDAQSVLWLSYTVFLLVGFGILFRSSYLIGSQINIAFVPYLSWSIDFYSNLLIQKNLWGITNYLFSTRSFLSQFISIQHLFVIPIALISLYFVKIKRKNFWFLSLIQITVFFIATRLLTSPSENINCVFESCLPIKIMENYEVIWFAAFAAMIISVNFLLTNIKILNHKTVNNVPGLFINKV